jgi:hypothetical protein
MHRKLSGQSLSLGRQSQNVDASYHADAFAWFTRVVLRDYQGNFIEDCIAYLPHVASPSMDETLAMREGVTLSILMGCNIVIAESNST